MVTKCATAALHPRGIHMQDTGKFFSNSFILLKKKQNTVFLPPPFCRKEKEDE